MVSFYYDTTASTTHLPNETTKIMEGGTTQAEGEVKTFKIVRGDLAKFDSTNMKTMQQLFQAGKLKELHNMISNARLCRSFSGALFSVCFKVNQPIVLTSLGFWGPFTGSRSNYKVKIIVTQSSKYLADLDHETVLEKTDASVEAEPKEIFYVSLPDEPLIVVNRWTRVWFQLDGPETCICSSVKPSYKCSESSVEFDFLESSFQLPVIMFQMPKP